MKEMIEEIEEMGVDLIDIYEQMLYQRAARGIRPMIYVSSNLDLECNMVMLLDETPAGAASGAQRPVPRGLGFHIVTN